MAKPFDIGDDVAFVDASVGLTMSDGHGHTPEQLLRHADVALYEAKSRPGSSIMAYREAMSTRMHRALDLERRLRRAVADDEFWAAFQPIVTLPDGVVMGHEALARWTSDAQVIPPDDFIPVAESAALLDEIGRRVILQALQFQARGPSDGLMFVNVAPSQIAAESFLTWLFEVLAHTGADAHRLIMEITEMSAVTDARISPTLQELRRRGVRIALDDFGTGHSSLASLHNLPVDILKIDRTLLADAPTDARAREISRMICDLGRNLGLEVIAEGVETPEHVEILVDAGCRLAQGYLFGRPAPAPG
jgi:EAL domain-containing protein (putative c-di-GMP-specific phosphodiesterase class I)